MLDDLDLRDLPDVAAARRVIARVLNLVEELSAELATATAEIQRLRDENNRLKGEQAKPRLLPSKRTKQDQSSEQERRERPKTWCKRASCPTCASTAPRSAGWTEARCRRMRCSRTTRSRV
jgi:hypothetical protein